MKPNLINVLEQLTELFGEVVPISETSPYHVMHYSIGSTRQCDKVELYALAKEAALYYSKEVNKPMIERKEGCYVVEKLTITITNPHDRYLLVISWGM